MTKIGRRMLRVWALALGMAMVTAGCNSAPRTVGVEVVGVNYTDDEYSLLLHDPTQPSNVGSSGGLAPFSAGGQMCCFALPEKWHPGIKVEVTSSKSIVENGQFVRDDNTTKVVELPPYTAGEPGTLWVLQFPDGQVEAISSTLSPEHPQWPGKVKGWPVPSLAYRTKIWKIYYDQAVSNIALYKGLIADMQSKPKEIADEFWTSDQRHRKAEVSAFRDQSDPAYIEYLKTRFVTSLNAAVEKEQKLRKARPQ